MVFLVKLRVDGQEKTIECFKQRVGVCKICYAPKSKLVTFASKCQHAAMYCLQCISKSIAANVCQKGMPRFKCVAANCSVVYEPQSVFAVLDKKTLGILDKLLLHKALESNHEFRWCKSKKGCGYGQLIGNWTDLRGYYCCEACGEQHCFQHEVLWHKGFSCDEFDREMKANPDMATSAVLKAFTKPCPNCKVPIAKLAGCDVMTCCQYGTHGCSTNKKKFAECDHGGKFCGQKFCWRCCGKITLHKRGGYRRHCDKNCQYADLN